MEELLGLFNAGNITVIVVAAVIYYPLKLSVDALSRSVDRLADTLGIIDSKVDHLTERVVALETKVKILERKEK